MDRCDLIPMFIIASCVMHNICLFRGDEIDLEMNKAEDNDFHYQDVILEQAGVAKRDLISERLPMRNI